MSAEIAVKQQCRACGHLYDGKASDEDLKAHLTVCPGPCPSCGEMRHTGPCPEGEGFYCPTCDEGSDADDCNCWEYYDDGRCHKDHTPEHCCSCGNGPYCQCCKRCGASCMGSCRCPIEVKGFDGETVLTLPGVEPDDDGHQQFKDDVAMGYIDRAGNQLDPPEPDWAEYYGGGQ